jgi:hypothetical protein
VSYHTSAKQLGLNKIKEFEFEVQTVQPFMYKPTCKDFIQASKLPSELLFRHYTCYSDTRGVTYTSTIILSMLSSSMLLPWFPISVENRDLR